MESIKKYVIKDSHGNIKAQGGLSVVGEVNVAVDGDVGTPTADAVYNDGVLTITLHDIKGERGNGITDIEVDEQEGDEAVNTVTFKTTDNQEGTSFHIKNGRRGNGIADITEERSEDDGGANKITITLDDETTFVVYVLNGQKGEQGDSVLVGQGDLPLAHTLGLDNTKAMSQKGVTDAIQENRAAVTLSDGYTQTVIGGTISIEENSSYKYYLDADIEVGTRFIFTLKSFGNSHVWAKLKNGKITEISRETSGTVVSGELVCDGTFDQIVFNSTANSNPSIVKCFDKMEASLLLASKSNTWIENNSQKLNTSKSIVINDNTGYTTKGVGEKPVFDGQSGYGHVVVDNCHIGYKFVYTNLRSFGGGTNYARVWLKLKGGIIVARSSEAANTSTSGEVICDGTFDQIAFQHNLNYAYSIKKERIFTSLCEDEVVLNACKSVDDIGNRMDDADVILHSTMPFNDIPLEKNPDSLKVLCFGNSFTNNTFSYVYSLMDSMGLSNKINIGIMYYSGRPLIDWVNAFDNNTNDGTFAILSLDGSRNIISNTTPKQAIDYQDWDIILLQESPSNSAKVAIYSNGLVKMINRIRAYSKNRPKIIFSHVWSTTDATGSSYGGDYEMYLSLMDVAKILRNKYKLDIVVPLYQSFQKVRENAISEGMNDLLDNGGLHANDYGQIVAGLTIIESFFSIFWNKSIRNVTYRDAYLTNENAETIIELVRQSCAYPFDVVPELTEEE